MIHRDTLLALMRDTRLAIAEARGRILDDLLSDLGHLAAMPEEHLRDDDWDAPSPEPLDADEYRALVRPAPTPEPEPEPEEFAVVRAAPAAAPETPPEPPKRPRRRTPPPAAPLPGPVDEAVEAEDDPAVSPF